VLTKVSHGVEDLNSIWVTDFGATKENTMLLNGFTVYRTRIPRLAALFDNCVLREVTVQSIRDQEVFKYVLEVPAVSAAPAK
jgi:hypothetical protein